MTHTGVRYLSAHGTVMGRDLVRTTTFLYRDKNINSRKISKEGMYFEMKCADCSDKEKVILKY